MPTITVSVSHCPNCNARLGQNMVYQVGPPMVTCKKCGAQVLTPRREWDDFGIKDKLLFLFLWLVPLVGWIMFPIQLSRILPSIKRTRQRPGGRPRILLRHVAIILLPSIAVAITLAVRHQLKYHPTVAAVIKTHGPKLEAMAADLREIAKQLPPIDGPTGMTPCINLNPAFSVPIHSAPATANWIDANQLNAPTASGAICDPLGNFSGLFEYITPGSNALGNKNALLEEGVGLRDRIDEVVDRPYLVVSRAGATRTENGTSIGRLEGFVFDRRTHKLVGSYVVDVPWPKPRNLCAAAAANLSLITGATVPVPDYWFGL